MIEAMERTNRVPKARIVCDGCGLGEVVTCDYERNPDNSWSPNEGQALRKLPPGWTHVKGRIHCPKCEKARKTQHPKREDAMPENVTDIRQPTREQRREIVSMLEEVYDTDRERYSGGETDKSVAEAIGSGCMPGWVAEIRESMFGPDGGNDDMATLAKEIAEWRASIDKAAADLHDRHVAFSADLRKFNEDREKANEFLRRLEAIKAAVGPKAARV